jgi:hypothetical protein
MLIIQLDAKNAAVAWKIGGDHTEIRRHPEMQ